MDVLTDAVAAVRVGLPHSTRTEFTAPWGVRFRAQPGAGFHVVLRGSCWLLPITGEPIRLGAGDVALLPRELGHGLADSPTTPLIDRDSPLEPPPYAPPGDTVMLCGAYRLDQSRLHPLLAALPEVVHIPARVGGHTALRGAIELLGHELAAGPRPGTSGVIPPLLDVLLLYLLRAWYDDRPDDATGWVAALRDPAVAAALRHIHTDPGAPWTVESLAARAGSSRSALAHRFTALVGSGPAAYLTWWRMTTAAKALRESDAPLRTIAARAGYSSEYAFAKAFKREFGVAPGRYRRGS